MMRVRCVYKELVDIKDLRPHPKHRNRHPKKQIEALANIVRETGWRRCLTISNRSGYLTVGRGRMMVAEYLNEKYPDEGWNMVPADRQDYDSEAQEYADVQADNAIALWAELDIPAIKLDIKEFPELKLELLGIEKLQAISGHSRLADDDIPEVVKNSRVRRGEIWQLGRHRLMCGDSTAITDVEKLMNGEKATILLTDPPYGVGYADRQEMMNEWGKRTGLRGGNKSITKPIENDHGSIDECGEIWLAAYSNALMNCHEKSSFYIFSPQGGDLMMMMMMMIRDSGWTLKHMLVWVKNNHVLGRCDYHYKHEPIFYGWNKGHDFHGGSSCFSVLEFARVRANDLHPTMKPVELLEHLITNSSQTNENVIDLFGGSGSTLIACEKTNRRCFMMEIDPHYCEVILTRWEKYTGVMAERIGG